MSANLTNMSARRVPALGIATVPVALVGVPPNSSGAGIVLTRSDWPTRSKVFGETPKTAAEPPALPSARAVSTGKEGML